MSILCKLFGHQPPIYKTKGWYSPGEQYATLTVNVTDGIGRTHAEIKSDCARCGENFLLCRVHLPTEE